MRKKPLYLTANSIQDKMMEWECFDDEVILYDDSDQQMDIYKNCFFCTCSKPLDNDLACTKRCIQKQDQQLVKPHNEMLANHPYLLLTPSYLG